MTRNYFKKYLWIKLSCFHSIRNPNRIHSWVPRYPAGDRGLVNPTMWNPELSAAERAMPAPPLDVVGEWPARVDLTPNLENHWYRESPWMNRYSGFNRELHERAIAVMRPILMELDLLTFNRNLLLVKTHRDPYGTCVTTLIQIYLYDQRLVVPHVGQMTYGKIDALRRTLKLHLDYQINSLYGRLMLKLLRMGNMAGFEAGYLHVEEDY